MPFLGQAQQEVMYTQFMFNKLALNPGYAGSFESPELTAVYRNQWAGIEGAPKTIILSYNQPILNNRVGIGGNLSRVSIGITKLITVDIAYAYRVKFRRGQLSVGLSPSIRHLYQDWTDPRIIAATPNDGTIPTAVESKILANVGFGAYYKGQNWYAGLSAPRIIENSIDFAEVGQEISREVRHFNAMGGMTFKPSKDVGITPQILIKYALNAPLDADLNVSLLMKQKFYGGLTYRLGGNENFSGESLDIMLGIQATEKLFVCVNYDIGISRLARYSNGSFEMLARWWFNPPEGVTVVPPTPW